MNSETKPSPIEVPTNITNIARVCHAANKAWCESNGDHTQKPWEEAEAWQRESAIQGVEFALANPEAPDSAQHDSWVLSKLKAGWKYGPVKDAAKKEHPCIIPFEALPEFQRKKDSLFRAIVNALK